MDQHKAINNVMAFLASVTADSSLRDACHEALAILKANVFRAVEKVAKNSEEMAKLDSEDKRLVEVLVADYRRAGAHESERMRDIARTAFEKRAEVTVSLRELDGVPDFYLDSKGLAAADGGALVTIDVQNADYLLLMAHVRSGKAREKINRAYFEKFAANDCRIRKLTELQATEAMDLKYESRSHYTIESLMARSPQEAMDFLGKVSARYAGPAVKHFKKLQALKAADAALMLWESRAIDVCDAFYYGRILNEHRYLFSHDEVSQYMHLAATKDRVLAFVEGVLGLRTARAQDVQTWHPDVEVYEVYEAERDVFVGHIYLDLFAREGKYSKNSTVQCLRPGHQHADGTREYPAAVGMGDFIKPTRSAPALRSASELALLAALVGGALSMLCSQTKWGRLHSSQAGCDFISAQAMLMGCLAWDPAFLRSVAVHHATGKPMPRSLARRIAASKNSNAVTGPLRGTGITAMHELMLFQSPFLIHSPELAFKFAGIEAGLGQGATADQVVNAMYSVRDQIPAGAMYTSLWSNALANALFAGRFVEGGINNPQTWKDYRDEVLRPGYARDPLESLARFLGCTPSARALGRMAGPAPGRVSLRTRLGLRAGRLLLHRGKSM
ncbi:metalloendopeptidase [Coemansia javaensis]|uniref:Metalloendopeptidase n=1 Tax=Coemansia javaensis TaxID=2761396 RepID=A0A9W8HFW2_9FUNG|nr:metalloendopeptidase [Coemansia javaensis]